MLCGDEVDLLPFAELLSLMRLERSPGQPKQGSYGGPQHPVSVTLSNGETAAVYAEMGPLSYLQAGDCLLVEPKQRGNGYRVSSTQPPELTATLQQRPQQNPSLLAQLQPAPVPPPPPMPQANGHVAPTPTGPLTPDKSKAIASWLKDNAAPLYGYCSELAAEQLGSDTSLVQLVGR